MNLPVIKNSINQITLVECDDNYYIHSFCHSIVNRASGLDKVRFKCDNTIIYKVDGDNLIIKSNIPLFHTNDKLLVNFDKYGNVYAGIEYIVYNINNKIRVVMMSDEPTKMITQ